MIFLHLSLPFCGPCDVPSNKAQARGRQWWTINTIHSLFFFLFFFPKCHFRTSERYIPADSPTPPDPNAFWPSNLIWCLFPTMWARGINLLLLLLLKDFLSEVTFCWKYTIVHSVSTPGCYSANNSLNVLLLWGRKLLLSQLGSLIKSDASIDTLPDSLRLWCFDVCFQLKPNHDPGWLLCSSSAFKQKWKGTLVNEWQHGRLGSCYSNSVCKPGWEREVSSIMFYHQTLNWS